MGYILIIMNLIMFNQDFGSLLGADISEASFLGKMEKTERPDFDMYHIIESKLLFLDKYQSQFMIATRDDDTIREIMLYLPPVMDKETLVKEMSDVYGKGKIWVVDEITFEEPWQESRGELSMRSKETRMTLKEGTMKEDVVHVIWEVEDVQIMLHLHNPKGTYWVRFSKDIYNTNR